jgi:hypothetical protein
MIVDRDSLIMRIVPRLRQARDAAVSDVIRGELDQVVEALQSGGDLDYRMLGLQVNLAANDFINDRLMMEELKEIGATITNELPLLLEESLEPAEEPEAEVAEQEREGGPETPAVDG